MKVTLEKNYRSRYTLEQLDEAKALIKEMKAVDSTAENMAVKAVELLREKHDWRFMEVISAEAYTMENRTLEWNELGWGTGYMDVCISLVALSYEEVVRAYVMLSDITKGNLQDCNTYVCLYKRVYEA